MLADKRYVTLVLRLVLDQRGRFLYGQLVDADGAELGGFSRWRDLLPLLRARVEAADEGDAPSEPADPA